MTREEAIKILMDGELNPCVAEDREACDMAIKALEQESMENFESVKDHIFKLAGDYKCWDNRLTYDEALELCHILEQEPCDDAISRQEVLNNAYAYGNGLEPDGYCVNVEDIQALPPVTPHPRSEVLDKIRDEIERKAHSGQWSDATMYGMLKAVAIIDKYKAESEE